MQLTLQIQTSQS